MTTALAKNDRRYWNRLIALSGLLSIVVTGPLSAGINPAMAARISQATQANDKQSQGQFSGQGSGTLLAMASSGKQLGECPLKHTSVSAKISGYISRVTVKQTFANPFKDKIEATYTFPLSETGAVDEMVMKIGTRTIHGTIKKKEEAREIYEQAKASGHVASLLDQERPNIFTQQVANIEPGKEVEITLQYIDVLPFEDGKYTFAFPTVVGPRFVPGAAAIGHSGTGRIPDTDRVPDASKITPPVAAEGTRAGHDISISVDIDAGIPISNIRSALHEVAINSANDSKASVSLTNKRTIPNKDFVLSWDVSGDSVKSGYLTYRDPKVKDSGFFTMMLLPPKRVTPQTVAPKEMIFLVDCSGSQGGPPIQKAKETLTYIVDHMNPQDTFQIVSFNNRASFLFDKPKQSNAEMKAQAKKYIDKMQAMGGTWMKEAVDKVCAHPSAENRLRVVTFMTDGYVGNDMEVLGTIKKMRGKSRWFSFGTGNSVNRFLIDGIAKEGGGEADYVLLNSSASAVGKKFYDRISSPVLTDVEVKFDGVDVKEVFPKEVSDVWAQKPLYIKGRYTAPGAGTVTLTGFSGGKPYKQTMKVNFPETNSTNSGIASIWARAKVDRLMSEDWIGAQSGNPNKELKDEITKTALDYHIMSQYTSFVAVDDAVTKKGDLKSVTVPVELPDGVSREGALGYSSGLIPPPPAFPMSMQPLAGAPAGSGGGYGGGWGGPSVRGNLARTKSGFYTAPRRMQVLDSRPIVKDFRNQELSALPPPQQKPQPTEKKAEEADKSVADPATSKLEPRLRNLASALKSNPNIPGLTIKDGKVLIKVTLNDGSKAVLAILKKAGMEDVTIQVEGSVFTARGNIKIELLTALAKLSQVLNIEPAK